MAVKKNIFVPIKAYPYQGLRAGIAGLVSNPEFLTLCDHWRNGRQEVPDGVLADIYDGSVWKDFNSNKYNNYLKTPGNLLLGCNVDWFQPFVRTVYSVGVLYLVVLNLPRNVRYKVENVIIVGIIPGPKEPKLTMNSFIGPLVNELNSACKGWCIPTKHPVLKSVVVRLCIGCITCDIPATRKLCGFLGHSATLGCNKCLKKFLRVEGGDKRDYSGFNRSEWEFRTKLTHVSNCEEIKGATCKTALENLEAKYGVRYSVLIDLPFFEPIRFPVIDVMHNLLLGTPKHAVKMWIKKQLLTQQDLLLIQQRSELLSFPHDIGRIPCKIASGFSGFTADQWRVWTTISSPIVLKGILPNNDLSCWLLFVNACRLLMTRIITVDNIAQADEYLTLFCKKFESLYGKAACTPNQHLHMHLKDCFLDYGPSHGFWCFPFERYNGILGGYPTNNKNVEVQLLNRFIRHQSSKRMSIENEWFSNDLDLDLDAKGSMQETMQCEVINVMKLAAIRQFNLIMFQLSAQEEYITFVPPKFEKVLSDEEVAQLRQFYQQLYPSTPIQTLSVFYTTSKKIALVNDLIKVGSTIMAYWAGSGGSLMDIDYSVCRVGVIQYFLKHSVKFLGDSTSRSFALCYVKWMQTHPYFDYFGKSAVISSTLFEVSNVCSYIPVQRIAYQCAYGEMSVDFGHIREVVYVASPIAFKFCI